MALSSDPEEVHIFPPSTPHRHAREQVGNALEFTLLLNAGSSGGGRPSLVPICWGLQQGHPVGTSVLSGVWYSVSHCEH